VWRSPVAYTSGGRVVAGSNPVTPTIYLFKYMKTNTLGVGFIFYPQIDPKKIKEIDENQISLLINQVEKPPHFGD
jgi:hypothetical protein